MSVIFYLHFYLLYGIRAILRAIALCETVDAPDIVAVIYCFSNTNLFYLDKADYYLSSLLFCHYLGDYQRSVVEATTRGASIPTTTHRRQSSLRRRSSSPSIRIVVGGSDAIPTIVSSTLPFEDHRSPRTTSTALSPLRLSLCSEQRHLYIGTDLHRLRPTLHHPAAKSLSVFVNRLLNHQCQASRRQSTKPLSFSCFLRHCNFPVKSSPSSSAKAITPDQFRAVATEGGRKKKRGKNLESVDPSPAIDCNDDDEEKRQQRWWRRAATAAKSNDSGEDSGSSGNDKMSTI
ncbi:hypothetical protein GW17_00023557 [Ensete ventricosum]|nr:hypothetical protein GW17_00023557 [Ensete ventricosum]